MRFRYIAGLLLALSMWITAASPMSAIANNTTNAVTNHTEVLGFAESGEVSSGQWRSDFHFNLLSTIAYFAINANADGSLETDDSGYQTWVSSETTDLINTAHAHGVRVVLTITCFDNDTIAGATGTESSRQALIGNIIDQLRSRGADGVNIDFEGFDPALAPGYTAFVAELHAALHSQIPQATYLTIDTYGSAATDSTMFDIPALKPYVDAFDIMAYDITAPGSPAAGPVAPLTGNQYSDTNIVQDYLAVVPPSQIILGIPYYGYKWSTILTDPSTPPGALATAADSGDSDFYSNIYTDFACAPNLTQYWDAATQTPYATWWSPPSGDPCGGNYGAWRELYYENAHSLGLKYDLVNAHGLRGIGIWALGFDSGHNELWNEIATKFSPQHGPLVTVASLRRAQSGTNYTLQWKLGPGSLPARYYSIFIRDGSGPWVHWYDTTNTSVSVYGIRGHTYRYYVQAFGGDGRSSGGPSGNGQTGTTITSNALLALPILGI